MLARLYFRLNGVALMATIEDDRHWSCPVDPQLARFLDFVFPADQGPEYGVAGTYAANQAAAYLNATVEIPRRQPAPEGVDF